MLIRPLTTLMRFLNTIEDIVLSSPSFSTVES